MVQQNYQEECEKNKLDVCMFPCRMVSTHDEHTAMAKAGNECQPTVYMSLHGNIAIGLLRGSVVPDKFLLMLLNTLLAEPEPSHALLVVWSHGNEAR